MSAPSPASGLRYAAAPLPVRLGLALVLTTSLLTAALLAITAVAGQLFGTRGLYNPEPGTLPMVLGRTASHW